MTEAAFDFLRAEIAGCRVARPLARVTEVGRGLLRIVGAAQDWGMGDRVLVGRSPVLGGEVVALDAQGAMVLTDEAPEGMCGSAIRSNAPPPACIAPDDSWLGRVIDPFGRPLDGRPLMRGAMALPLRAAPPAPAGRRRLGARLETGMRVFNTLLPLVRGQRIGLFAGSGVGKSTLLAQFARHVAADVIVIALIGERGRELRDFVEDVLGPEGMARAVVVAATSDQSALIRRRCAWAAMAVAERFRDQGKQVLFLADSVTRLAEAHREVALAAGEPPSLRGFPPSTAHLIMALAERAGPGRKGRGIFRRSFRFWWRGRTWTSRWQISCVGHLMAMW